MVQFIKRGAGALALLGALVWSMAPAAPAPAAPPPTDAAAFVQAATQDGMLEVEAGKVAMNASTNDAVKTFADRMITDHGRANAELAVIAKKKSINVPTELDAEHMKMLKTLREKSAKEFDAAYAAHMAQDHAKAIELFEANISNADGEIGAFVALTLPVLKEHKRLADNLKINLKK